MDVRELVACPACGGPLSAGWSCRGCAARFDVADGVPNLRLGSDRRTSGPADQRADGVTETVRRFYESAPFPGYPPRESLQSLRARAERNAFARLLDRAIAVVPNYADPYCFKAIIEFRYRSDAAAAQQPVATCLAANPPQEVRGLVEGLKNEIEAALAGGAATSAPATTTP